MDVLDSLGGLASSVVARTCTVGLEDVGLDERLVLAALVVLNTGDKIGREMAYDRMVSGVRSDSSH